LLSRWRWLSHPGCEWFAFSRFPILCRHALDDSVALIWAYILNPSWGAVNQLLEWMGLQR
jgi:hypothetical protein